MRSIKPTRSTKIPKDFLQWCKENHPKVVEYHELESYNDLNVLIKLSETHGKDEEVAVINEARKLGILPESGFAQLEE